MRRNILLTLVILTGGAAAAHAQSRLQDDFYNDLTPENIKSFMQKTDALSTGQMQGITASDLNAYFTRHLADNGAFKSNTTFNIPGQSPKTQTETLSKAQFITNVQQGHGMIKNDQTELTVTGEQIDKDGKNATLKTISTDKGILSMPDGKGGAQDVAISGLSTCVQTLTLPKNHYIQMVGADCETVINVTSP